jgi:hypothetical protein
MYSTAAKDSFFCVTTKGNYFFSKFFKTSEIQKAIDYISSQKVNVYISLNTFTEPKRSKSYCCNPVWNIFLDFDRTEKFKDFLMAYRQYATIIQTSPGKYQVVMKLAEPVSIDIAENISKQLALTYLADHTHDCTRIIRCPDTLNIKYNPPFKAKLIKYATSRLPLQLLPKVDTVNLTKERQAIVSLSCDYPSTEKDRAEANRIYQRILKSIPEKAHNPEPDYSIADMKFVVYTLSIGWSPEKIAAALMSVSPYLTERKKNNAQAYIMRTINAGIAFKRGKNGQKR